MEPGASFAESSTWPSLSNTPSGGFGALARYFASPSGPIASGGTWPALAKWMLPWSGSTTR